MEEERRLMYVGMTRARQELYLTYATERNLYGGRQHNPPSRFISDIGAAPDTTANGLSNLNQTIEPFDDSPRYVIELEEGDGVRHKIFGPGTVVELDGDNATVYFKGKGTKRLNIAFAPLEKI
jgi:DNA helicase-2/ATP-dependent DNA helicase PcrA